jgi:hypothetical protein
MNFPLKIDFLRLNGTQIERDGRLELPNHSAESGALFLPSSRFIVNDGRDLTLFTADRTPITKRSIEQVCGRSLSRAALLSASLIRGSDRVSLLIIDEEYGKSWQDYPRRFKPSAWKTLDYCWFSNDNLELLARGGSVPYGDYRPTLVESFPAHGRTLITPQGIQNVDFPCEHFGGAQRTAYCSS